MKTSRTIVDDSAIIRVEELEFKSRISQGWGWVVKSLEVWRAEDKTWRTVDLGSKSQLQTCHKNLLLRYLSLTIQINRHRYNVNSSDRGTYQP